MIVVPENVNDTIRMADWCASLLNEPIEAFSFDRYGQPLFQCMGFSRNNELVCVVVCSHQTTDNVIAAFAATTPRWASKQNIAAWGDWIFQQMGVSRVTATVLKSNKRSRKFAEGIGFKVEGKLRKAASGEDMIIYGLLKEEFENWLRKAFNVKGKHEGSITRPV